ncbi:MAG: hypothetical protein EOP49_25345 [Sphingobacteriales bacterium]|nr:MAG: hypothetical protein EOP49_25345 [Sphingobacteriales bacterium]
MNIFAAQTGKAMTFFNYNGRMYPSDKAVFTAGNRALRLGEGLIETMYHANGRIALWEYHWQRLESSLQTIGFPATDKTLISQAVSDTLQANGNPDGVVVRAQFFREQGDEGLHYFLELLPPPRKPEQWPDAGLRLGITSKVLKCADAISMLKTASRMQYQMAATDAQHNHWDDALLSNAAGNIVESTHSNIFIVMKDKVYTPPLSEGCVAGVMRAFLLTESGLGIEEEPLNREMLPEADEIFLTNAVRGIQPVRSCMNKTYEHGYTRELFEQYNMK